ncbi:MAG: DUF6270 domain-containing protein [Methanobacteriaceae archaeon]|nr:DUF6270 domain-containing protein [Methanobacteriaceae archaeon]
MNLIYNDSCNGSQKDYSTNNLIIQYNKKGIKLEPKDDKGGEYILNKSSRWFLPPQFKIEFDITEIEGSVDFCISSKSFFNNKKDYNKISTEVLDLKEGTNHITIHYDRKNTIFKNESDVKFTDNIDFIENISFWISFKGDSSKKSITLKNIKISTNIPIFCVFGSCTTRDIFFGGTNKGYKNHFLNERTLLRSTIISLMDDPVDFNEEDIIVPEGAGGEPGTSKRRTERGRDDLNKKFLEDLIKIQPEFLIMDIIRDMGNGNLQCNDGKYMTLNHPDLKHTPFYQEIKDNNFLKIQEDKEMFFEVWKERCGKFFKFMNKNCPNTIIILNSSKYVTKMLTSDGDIVETPKYIKKATNFNYYITILENYICDNFDVEVLEFDENTLSYENHRWTPSPLHYEPYYYQNRTEQLDEIIERNRSIKTEEELLLNNKIRKERREKIILQNKLYEMAPEIRENSKKAEQLDVLLSSNSWKLTKPLRAVGDVVRKLKK